MEEHKDNILGCYVSYPTLSHSANKEDFELAKQHGDIFVKYIWGEKGISDKLKTLKFEKYGKDLRLILFEFYVMPILYADRLKEIQNYRSKEKSIGISIFIDDKNFFNKSEDERYDFLKEMILQRIDQLADRIKKNKLDTNVDMLKGDIVSLGSLRS